MSVPLPSPSPLAPASAESIPRSRPQPITAVPSGSPHSPQATPGFLPSSPGSPKSASYRKGAGTARSIGFNGAQSGGGDSDNWRERGNSVPRSAVRTVGFDKAGASKVTGSPAGEREGSNGTTKNEDSKAAALSHVPCRFYKAGSCTAGATCPFSHGEGGKKEVCQWFLKGSCKFGHKCALAHVRPGEQMSMDRKNKKAAQLEARERVEVSPHAETHNASPVPIRSALSSSLQSPPAYRLPSSPLREPIGPPANGGGVGGTSPGFARSPAGAGGFASSPSRPSPLSGNFGGRQTGLGPISLKATSLSSLRPPSTAFSSSFSHSALRDHRARTSPVPPLSASFADGSRKNIWARNESPNDQPETLSPRRPIIPRPRNARDDVFIDDGDDHGEDLLPSSLSDLLTPKERARRNSRRDSQESFSASPSRNAFGQAYLGGGERLAQSAGPTMGPGFLNGLWSAEGSDARKGTPDSPPEGELAFGPATAQTPRPRQSLLTQQRSPISPQGGGRSISPQRSPKIISPIAETSPFYRHIGSPSSPSSRALQEHAPGQSLPGGVATALSRLHLHGPRSSSGLAHETGGDSEGEAEKEAVRAKKEDHDEEGLFVMDG